ISRPFSPPLFRLELAAHCTAKGRDPNRKPHTGGRRTQVVPELLWHYRMFGVKVPHGTNPHRHVGGTVLLMDETDRVFTLTTTRFARAALCSARLRRVQT